jgi:hypothetical protein
MASHNVHANPKSVLLTLGLTPESSVLLTGPSDMGLDTPIGSAIVSLLQATTPLVTTWPPLDGLVVLRLLTLLADDVNSTLKAAAIRATKTNRRSATKRALKRT